MTDNGNSDRNGPEGEEAAGSGQARPDNGDGRPDQPRRGAMRFQDAESTTPREPTVGEQRARRMALERQREEQIAVRDAAERKSKVRRRILIGSGVTVGVVAMVAVWYAAATPDEVTANCVADDDVIQTEDNCDEDYVRSHNGYHSGGFFFLPIGGGGYRQYHYNYGGTGAVGQKVSGGSTVAPSGSTVKTSSGKTIQRGGFGISGGGKSGGS